MQADEIPEEILPHLVEWGMGDRFLSLPSRFDIHEWDIMRRFALSLEDEGACDRLMNDLRGRGAFGRFKNRVHKLGLADQWYAYRDAALRQIAIDWCEEHDLRWYERNPPASQQPCDDPPSGQVP